MIQILVDYSQGVLEKRPSIFKYYLQLIAFYTLLAGPIWRYDKHMENLSAPTPLSADNVYMAFSRGINGVIKVAFFGAIILKIHNKLTTYYILKSPPAGFEDIYFIIIFLLSALCFALYIYIDFSGYMDIVIGIGMLLGLKLPENFNKPYLSKDFLDLWTRWHITLSEWFKYYLFNPVLKFFVTHLGGKVRPEYLGCIAYFIVFFVMGLWHGPEWTFLLYGISLGGMASCTKLWQVVMVKLLGKKTAREIEQNLVYQWTMRSIGLSGLVYPLSLWWVDSKISNSLTIFKFVLVVMLSVILLNIIQLFSYKCKLIVDYAFKYELFKKLIGKKDVLLASPVLQQPFLAIKIIFVIFTHLTLNYSVPVFVYQGF